MFKWSLHSSVQRVHIHRHHNLHRGSLLSLVSVFLRESLELTDSVFSGWAANETVCQSLLEVRFTATGCDNVATAFTSNASSVAITASAALIVFAWENSEQNQSDSAIPQSLETPTTQTAVPLPTIQNTPHPFMGLPNNPTATLTSTSGAIPNRWRCEGALRLSVLVAVVVSLI